MIYFLNLLVQVPVNSNVSFSDEFSVESLVDPANHAGLHDAEVVTFVHLKSYVMPLATISQICSLKRPRMAPPGTRPHQQS